MDGDRSWSPHRGRGLDARLWLPLVTRWLEAGGSPGAGRHARLLGEGWDCPPLNVVVDLTGAATPAAVDAARGRSLRLDPERPDKVGRQLDRRLRREDHPRGDADYLRAVRKHEHHLAPGHEGLVESGIGHCDEVPRAVRPAGQAGRDGVNARALARASERDAVRTAWAVGEDYRGVELTTLRVRAERPLGLPGGAVPAALLAPRRTLGRLRAGPAPRRPLAGAAVAAAARRGRGGGQLRVRGRVARDRARPRRRDRCAGHRSGRRPALPRADRGPAGDRGQEQTATLTQLAGAVADALHAAGATSVGARVCASTARRAARCPASWTPRLPSRPCSRRAWTSCSRRWPTPAGWCPGWCSRRRRRPRAAAGWRWRARSADRSRRPSPGTPCPPR
jgi:hypothetical protein